MEIFASKSEEESVACLGHFAFVIPVVHPDGEKVADYSVVEQILRVTVSSLIAQTHPDISIVIVCHRTPLWASSVDNRVKFVLLGDHPTFEANRNHVRVDKGMKYALGILYAIGVLQARFVMLGDGDDFVHRKLAKNLLSRVATARDGFILRRGVHVLLKHSIDRFLIEAALEVKDFHQTCGTCRIFTAESLTRLFEELDSEFFDKCELFSAQEPFNLIVPSAELLEGIDTLTDPIRQNESALIRMLGKHTAQEPFFEFETVSEPWAGKGCGHGNHDGPRSGDLHWHRVLRVKAIPGFLADFGLSGCSSVQVAPSMRSIFYAWYLIAKRWVFRPLAPLKRRLAKLTRA